MKISEALGINKSQIELDFFDYEIGKDTFKFIDPYYISKKEDAFLSECNEYVETFFNRFLDLLKRDEKKAFELFSHLGEVNEICLGMSSGKPSGKGIGAINTIQIFNAIKKSKAFTDGVAEYIEDVRIFVDGVDKDKISDMVANIIKYPLIKYTQEQCKLFGVVLSSVESGYYWNKDQTKWERGHQDMIVINGKHYLLFPKNLVSNSKHYCADEYLRMYVLEYLKEENIRQKTHLVHKSYKKDGTIKKEWVYKKEIVEDFKSQNIYLNKNWLADFTKNNPEIYKKFRLDTINKISEGDYCDITKEEEIEIINTLIESLHNIPAGGEHASQYQKLMFGILELLFYPYVAHPRLEQEIDEGRKRVDITFTNNAESGFFYVLPNTYQVPCVKIMVECKNYSKDIANPELDQMAGRFSPNKGKFGIICCRSLDNEKLFVEREKDTAINQRGWIIHITDDEIVSLLESRKTENKINEFLLEKFIEVNG